MSLSSLPTDLLLLCLEPSDGRVRRACKALCAAFDELAREKGVDLILSGWRNTSPCAQTMSDVAASATLRVRPVPDGVFDVEVVSIESLALDEASVQSALLGGRARFVGASTAFGKFNHRSTKCALLHGELLLWYDGLSLALCIERNGRYVRIIVRKCNSDRRVGCRYFTFAHDVDMNSPVHASRLAPFLELGPRILAAQRFCNGLKQFRVG